MIFTWTLIFRPPTPPVALISSTNAFTCFSWLPRSGTSPVDFRALKSTPMNATLIWSSVMPTVEVALAFSAARPVAFESPDPEPVLVWSELFVWLVQAANSSNPTASATVSRRVDPFMPVPLSDRSAGWGRLFQMMRATCPGFPRRWLVALL